MMDEIMELYAQGFEGGDMYDLFNHTWECDRDAAEQLRRDCEGE